MSRTFPQLAILVLVFLTIAPAQGFNLGFLQDSPASYLKDEDIEMFLDAAQQALASERDGVDIWWDNPKTGNNGSVTPIRSFQQDGRPCKRLRVATFAGERSGTSEFTFCQAAEGGWAPVTSR